MRLFVAIRFSPQVEQSLLRAQGALQRQGTGRFTRPENFHLTLAFIGETDRLDEAKEAVRSVSQPAFRVRLEGVGAFGNLYWAGIAPNPALQGLQREVSQGLRSRGFSLEKRAFRPHLTLCRQLRPDGAFALSAVEKALGTPECRITRVSLMESLRINGTLVYRERFGKNLL